MKKLIVAVTAALLFCTVPVYADDADLLARIEALEERVTALEALLSSSSGSAETVQTGEPVTLEVGTWIVGEDIPAGKYNLTCATDAGAMCTVYKSLEDKLNQTGMTDLYSISTEAYKEMYASLFDDDEGLSATLDSLQTEIFNAYISDGQCLEIEGGSITFTP